MKFTVIKNADIEEYLSKPKQTQLLQLLTTINNGRILDLKSIDNEYLVINRNESYADEVIEIMKRHGHWG